MLQNLLTFAESSIDYTTNSSSNAFNTQLSGSPESVSPGVIAVVALVFLFIAVISVIGTWKVFTKAGKPGWAAIIPFYNTYVLAQVAGRPGWFGLVASLANFVPFVGSIVSIVIMVILSIDVANRFRKSSAFGVVGLVIFSVIGYLVLGFGKAQYDPTVAPLNVGPVDTPPSQSPPTSNTSHTPPANPFPQSS